METNLAMFQGNPQYKTVINSNIGIKTIKIENTVKKDVYSKKGALLAIATSEPKTFNFMVKWKEYFKDKIRVTLINTEMKSVRSISYILDKKSAYKMRLGEEYKIILE